jgi:hypothetical protein
VADDHGLSASWPQEDVPDSDHLYMRVHRVFEVDGELQPGVFRDHPPKGESRAMSTDWSKYATPEETLRRAKSPSDNGVIGMVVGDPWRPGPEYRALSLAREPVPHRCLREERSGSAPAASPDLPLGDRGATQQLVVCQRRIAEMRRVRCAHQEGPGVRTAHPTQTVISDVTLYW